jgi:diaminopimelate epimerase
MRIKFSKMHGLGNDFVLIDNISRKIALSAEKIRHLADRRTGIGCDQVLLVESAVAPGADFAMRILNADGSEAEQCGNGVRCFTVFVRELGLASSTSELTIATAGGLVRSRLESSEQISVDMGVPRLELSEIPFLAPKRAPSYSLDIGGEVVTIGAVSMGNPHAVMQVDDVRTAPVSTFGPLIQRHRDFPRGANVGFMQVIDARHIRLRVFERGAGETPACGTGACAAVVVGHEQGLLQDAVEVSLPGGRLYVALRSGNCRVWMTGPAVRVFDGEIEV